MSQLNNFQFIREAALRYCDIKLPIMPICSADHSRMHAEHVKTCKYPGKTPVIKQWSQKQTTTPAEVKHWYVENPSYNIGLVLGETQDWNIVGVDVDGEAGKALLQQWSHGVLPPTWEFVTGGGGYRYLYSLPKGAKSKKFKQAEGANHEELALLVSGQQTVLPPSLHVNGNSYQWVQGRSPADIPMAQAPLWIINRVVQFEDENATDDPSRLQQWAQEKLSDPVKADDWTKSIQMGERSNHLTKLAGSLIARRNIPKSEVITFLCAWNNEHCTPPLETSEIEAMVESIYESEKMKQAKREAKKKERDNFFPVPLAHKWVNQQRTGGIDWQYTPVRGRFYRCDCTTGPWKPVSNIFVTKELRLFLISENISWDHSRFVNELLAALKEVLASPENDDLFNLGINSDTDHIFLRNGVLDWRTLELGPWKSEYYSTVQLPVDWDEEALDSPAYQRWEAVLEQWIPDAGSRMFIQEFIGYCLIPDCSFRTAVFLYGGGINGKSLFLECLQPLFGEYINHTTLQRLADRFETINLCDKLVNICADVDSTYLPETAVLKALISGDPIRAEAKFGNSFHFNPVARLLFSANTLPRSADKTTGWYSRWKFIQFPNQFAIDPNFKRKLLQEFSTPFAQSALLGWAVDGLRRLYEQGSFTSSKVMQTLATQYRAENDSVVGFVEAALKRSPEPYTSTNTLVVSSLYNLYKQWCGEMGLKASGRNEFSRRLQALNFTKSNRVIKKTSTIVILGAEFTTAEFLSDYKLEESLRTAGGKTRYPTVEVEDEDVGG